MVAATIAAVAEMFPPAIWEIILALIKVALILGFVAFNALFLIWLERKVSARIQNRVGPYRVGRPHGFLQTVADVIKLLAKEDVMPQAADRWVWYLAPVVMFIPALLVFLPIPFGPEIIVQDLNIGILYVAAVTSFTLLAVFMAGWGSNNKYSLLGAMRAAAQLFAYEVPLVISVIGVVMLAGSLSLQDIVARQERLWFVVPQILGFLVFYIASIAELNRTPFDLSEAESELVAGFATEYSGLRWAFFFLAEYTNLFTASAIAVTLFLGGWRPLPYLEFIPPIIWFLLKTYFLVFVAMWIRWTLPRVRIDQLLDIGWKFLLPVSLFNVLLTGLIIGF